MVWLFSKKDVDKIFRQIDVTRENLALSASDFDTLYDLISEVYRNKKEFDKKYKIISDASREAIILSVNKKIVEANRAAYDMIGYNYKQGELIEKLIIDLVFEKDVPIVKEHYEMKSTEVYEIRFIHKVGYLVPVEIQSKDVEYEGNEARITTCIDISKRKEEEIKRRDVELELKKTKARLGSMLLKRGLITRQQLDDSLIFQDNL
ncbi:PAS domain S-box protein, partial [bacterium]|nr:PAS domain S-box protein [bacterium]